jgi:hypothetical protein
MSVEDWIKQVLFGPGGMQAYEEHEIVVWNVPDREATAAWIIRCLANPRCEGSAEVLKAIAARREEVRAGQEGEG